MWKALNAQSGRWTHICCKSYDKANIELMWQLCTLTASLFDFSLAPAVTSAHPDPGVMVPEPSIDSPVPAPCEIGCQSVKLCPVSNQSNTYSLPNTWSCVRCQKYPSSPGSCWWLLPPSFPPFTSFKLILPIKYWKIVVLQMNGGLNAFVKGWEDKGNVLLNQKYYECKAQSVLYRLTVATGTPRACQSRCLPILYYY